MVDTQLIFAEWMREWVKERSDFSLYYPTQLWASRGIHDQIYIQIYNVQVFVTHYKTEFDPHNHPMR